MAKSSLDHIELAHAHVDCLKVIRHSFFLLDIALRIVWDDIDEPIMVLGIRTFLAL